MNITIYHNSQKIIAARIYYKWDVNVSYVNFKAFQSYICYFKAGLDNISDTEQGVKIYWKQGI